ncbi:MAG TPA: UDP-N-acetylmuramate--L-alanine ligase [Bacillota bacterium]|nr:UDP-N-acetylmuramate--L-alanine ligase [Peptococcaceae bacterium MAG4]NLW37901.1 UDP-N-acetylmuramate--L-alanine ligase [Peptococcaceae bacterium]HUM57976.1 UDP-N-acetylmuramate--L-alanine ligase [Bacillota bacterium]
MQKKQHVHFIGIGGTGMSAIARIMLELGYHVTGSDLKTSAASERLEALGAICYLGHAEENLEGADLVVTSTAIPPDNVELLKAREKGIPIMHRGEMLAWLMRRQKGIAIAGAHGKTTTTSMIALILEMNKLDPTILIGGDLSEIGGNAKLGGGDYLVAEADESDGSFLKLDPFIEVITNIEDDHLDYYKSFDNIVAAFSDFMAKVPDAGVAVVCYDNPVIRELLKGYKRPYLTYAVDCLEADYTLQNVCFNGQATAGDVWERGELLGTLELSVPGIHNLSNALAAVAVGRFIGLPFDGISESLKTFRGAGRRFQLRGEVGGIKVIDDYAHHPSEIKATLKAARQIKTGRVLGVFQPHRYTRTSLLGERFGDAFSDADIIIISDIYSAGERPIKGVSARTIVSAIEKHEGRKVVYLPTRQQIVDYLVETARPGDMILTMGAGDIWCAGVELVNRLKERHKIG